MVKKLDFLIYTILILTIMVIGYMFFTRNNDTGKITLNKKEITIYVGEKNKIGIDNLPNNKSSNDIKWVSDNTGIVTVDNNGIIEGVSKGDAIVTVSLNNSSISETCHVTVKMREIEKIELSDKSILLKTGDKKRLGVTITPSNINNYSITFNSSNEKIVSVDNSGMLTANKEGEVIITVIGSNGVSDTCKVIVENKKIVTPAPTPLATHTAKPLASPIIPSKYANSYVGDTIKYYIVNTGDYYLTYIWMMDPYNQIKKIDANTAYYGKIMTDDELASLGKKSVIKTVGEMLNLYIKNSMISVNDALVGFNASGFYNNGGFTPPDSYYHNRSDSYFVLNDGIVTRNHLTDGKELRDIVGIDSNGDFRVFGTKINSNERKELAEKIINEYKVKNTWSFHPTLARNGVAYDNRTTSAKRQAICQMDSNNYIMLTSINNLSFSKLSNIMADLKCKVAFNFDGGGSTSFFYKKKGETSVSKVICQNNNSGGCRSIAEGIYFVGR